MTGDRDPGYGIRTPDQRLRVFVSSTLGELAEERAVVARAISALRLTPILFELGARPHPPQELYRAYLRQSNIFVGLYWQRYGWVGPGMDISGLEDEFRLSEGMPRLLYLKTPAPDREDGLSAMIKQLQTEGANSYKSFRTTRELSRLIRDDLAVLLSERFVLPTDSATPAPGPGASGAPQLSHSLPSATTSLIGRDEDVAEVARLLQTPDVRLVTLTGPGGIGKTRLAIAVGERLLERYPRTVFVPLASIAQPELVVPRMAAAAGASLEGVSRPVDLLVAHLGGAPTLFILDNLEQVISAGPDLDEILARSPGVKMLATSRTVLRLRAEHEYRVEPLKVPVFSERLQLAAVAALPAVELFADRARAVRRDFALTQDNAFAVAEICRRLDGLPLAIELAAARVRLMDPAELLRRLGTRLDALGTGPADLPERQRTLRATIEWSAGLLTDSERDMLATLSVFADGWTIDAAGRVAGEDDNRILDLLDALSSHSLVSLIATDAGPRFHMLETVRDFATEMANATSEATRLRERHAAYFRDFVEETSWPFPDETAWAERLQAEEANIRLMVQWHLDHDLTPLPHLFRILWRFWQLRDRMAEGRAWIEELLPRVDTLDGQQQAEFWLTSAMTSAEVGEDDSALAAATELDRLEGRLNDPGLESATHLVRSWTLPILNDLDGALQAATSARQGFLSLDEPFMAANAAFTLGMLEIARGQYEAANQHLSEVRSASEQLGTSWLTAVATVEMSSLAVQAGRLDEARTLLEQSLELGTAQRSTLTLTFCLVALANLALADGNARLAATALGAAGGLRARAGLHAWPMLRLGEAGLRARVQSNLGPETFEEAFGAGSQNDRSEAIALIRNSLSG